MRPSSTGNVVSPTPNPTAKAAVTPTPKDPYDVDGNKRVNNLDVLALARPVLGFQGNDFNGDGKFGDIRDIIDVFRKMFILQEPPGPAIPRKACPAVDQGVSCDASGTATARIRYVSPGIDAGAIESAKQDARTACEVKMSECKSSQRNEENNNILKCAGSSSDPSFCGLKSAIDEKACYLSSCTTHVYESGLYRDPPSDPEHPTYNFYDNACTTTYSDDGVASPPSCERELVHTGYECSKCKNYVGCYAKGKYDIWNYKCLHEEDAG